MQYLLLIYETEADSEVLVDGAMMEEYREFTRRIVESGEFKAGDALAPISTATSVRVRDGAVLVTDGPFAETHEQLAGYYLVEAPDLDRAIEIARQIPSARHGTVEVRPVRVWKPE